MKKLMLLIPIILLIISCGGGGERASIEAYIYAWHSNNVLYREADIEIYKYNGFKAIPLVTVNEETLQVDNLSYSPYTFHYIEDIPWVILGSECKIEVDYGDGRGDATDTLPAEFRITSPIDGDTLHKGSDLNIAWQSSTGADWYWLYIDIDYDYIDTSGSWDNFSFSLDTIMHTTSYTLSASIIFPGDVDSITGSSNYVDLASVAGPDLIPGTEGNIKGNAVGFFWCSYYAQAIYFGVNDMAGKPDKDYEAEIRKRHREALHKFAEENQ